jgi:hypothetical protein
MCIPAAAGPWARTARPATDRSGQFADLCLVGRGTVEVTEVDIETAGDKLRQSDVAVYHRNQPPLPGRRFRDGRGELLVGPAPADRLRGHHEDHGIRRGQAFLQLDGEEISRHQFPGIQETRRSRRSRFSASVCTQSASP